MPKSKFLFTADDAGVVPQIDNAIIDLANRGILTSTEVLPNYGKDGGKSVFNAKRILDETAVHGKQLELGIHLTITSGGPVNEASKDGLSAILKDDGKSFVSYRDLGSKADIESLYKELKAQAEILLSNDDLKGRITHLTNHHDALWFYPEYTKQLIRLANELNLPIRNTRTRPDVKGWIYYVVQNLVRDISDEDKKKIKDAYEDRQNGFFPGESITYRSTTYMDNRHYNVLDLWGTVDPRDARISIRSKKRKLRKMFKTAEEVAEELHRDNSVEFMFHVRKGKILQYEGIEDLPYYNGISPEYFDGRTMEYRSLRDNSRFIQRMLSKGQFELMTWADCEKITLKKKP